MGKFNVGDRVTFIGINDRDNIPKFFTESDGIDLALIIHGSTCWDKNPAEVIGISNEYIVVNFKTDREPVQLGFKPESLELVEESSSPKREFKVGDKVKRVNNGSNNGFQIGEIGTIIEILESGYANVKRETGEVSNKNSCKNLELVEETPSKNVCKMTKKTIYNVLIVDKKTGKTTKDEKVTAANEQQAILKTFGVDAENTFIKITELGTYEEDKPIKAVIETVEEPKK